VPLDVGRYLRGHDVDAGNPVLREYVLGDGELFLITRTAKAGRFSVSYERKNGVGAKVDVKALAALTGGHVQVSPDASRDWVVSYAGPEHLVFGFQCFRLGIESGALDLELVPAGATRLAEAEPVPAMLAGDGLLSLGR
jgi:hypothetical protein